MIRIGIGGFKGIGVNAYGTSGPPPGGTIIGITGPPPVGETKIGIGGGAICCIGIGGGATYGTSGPPVGGCIMTFGGPIGFIGSVIMIGIGGGALGPVSE